MAARIGSRAGRLGPSASPFVAGALGALVVLAACSETGAPAPERPSILLVSIDTLRADHLGCYGYAPYKKPVSPAIDQLAAEGVLFERCFVPRGQTAPSLCSLMVGKYPSAHGVRENGQPFAGPQKTLTEHLARAGYRTGAFISRLPASPEGHPAQGAEVFVPGEQSGSKSQAESDLFVVSKAMEWLDGFSPASAEPFFCWVHLYDVHQPYTPVPPLDRRFARQYTGDLKRGERPDWPRIDARLAEAAARAEPLSDEDHRYVVALYDGGVRAADQLVEALLAKLDERELADRTLVMVTSDHGEELGDHEAYYFHGNSVYDGTLRVPWILRWPGVIPPGTTFEPLVQNVDVLPTLLTWIGAEIPGDVEGVSLAKWLGPTRRPGATGEPRERAYSEWQDLIWTVRDDGHKLVFNPRGAHPRKPPFDRFERGFRIRCRELYDVANDPGETILLPLDGSADGDRLLSDVKRFRERPGALTGWSVVSDAAVEENLAALGYIGTDDERSDVLIGAEECDE